jgi:hypothetical protein
LIESLILLLLVSDVYSLLEKNPIFINFNRLCKKDKKKDLSIANLGYSEYRCESSPRLNNRRDETPSRLEVLSDKVAFAVAVLADQRDRTLALDVADDLANFGGIAISMGTGSGIKCPSRCDSPSAPPTSGTPHRDVAATARTVSCGGTSG